MSVYDYSRLAGTATSLIDRFGRDATLTKLSTAGGYDPGDPSETEHPVRVVAWDYQQRERDGTLVRENDRRLIMDATAEPESQDMIEGMVIVNVEVIKPGPVALAYILQVRA
jgi:hypothetical protein